jgi:hypothetical protein
MQMIALWCRGSRGRGGHVCWSRGGGAVTRVGCRSGRGDSGLIVAAAIASKMAWPWSPLLRSRGHAIASSSDEGADIRTSMDGRATQSDRVKQKISATDWKLHIESQPHTHNRWSFMLSNNRDADAVVDAMDCGSSCGWSVRLWPDWCGGNLIGVVARLGWL